MTTVKNYSVGKVVQSEVFDLLKKGREKLHLSSVWGNSFFLITATMVAACGGGGTSTSFRRQDDGNRGDATGLLAPAGQVVNLDSAARGEAEFTVHSEFASPGQDFAANRGYLFDDASDAIDFTPADTSRITGNDVTGTGGNDYVFGNHNANTFYVEGAADGTFGRDYFIGSPSATRITAAEAAAVAAETAATTAETAATTAETAAAGSPGDADLAAAAMTARAAATTARTEATTARTNADALADAAAADTGDTLSLARLMVGADGKLLAGIGGFQITIGATVAGEATALVLDHSGSVIGGFLGTVNISDVERIIGSQGNDRVTGITSGLFYSLEGASEGYEITLAGTSNATFTSDSNNPIHGLDTISRFVNLIGGDGDDRFADRLASGNSREDNIFYGGGGNDVLDGNNGDDELYGGANNDILIGGLGQDTLMGGGGDDVIVLVGSRGATGGTTYDATDLYRVGLYDLRGRVDEAAFITDVNTASRDSDYDAASADTIDGGTGTNYIVIFNNVDLSGLTQAQFDALNADTFVVNSQLTLAADQLDGLTILGDGTSHIIINSGSGGRPSATEADFSDVTLENVREFSVASTVDLMVAADEISKLADVAVSGTGDVVIEEDIEVADLDAVVFGDMVNVSETVSDTATDITPTTMESGVDGTTGHFSVAAPTVSPLIFDLVSGHPLAGGLSADEFGSDITIDGHFTGGGSLATGESLLVTFGGIVADVGFNAAGTNWTATFTANDLESLRTESSVEARAVVVGPGGESMEATLPLNIDAHSSTPRAVTVATNNIVSPAEATAGFTIDGTADTDDTVTATINVDGTDYTETADADSSTGVFSISFAAANLPGGSVLPDGDYTATLTASDASGNTSSASTVRFSVVAEDPVFTDGASVAVTNIREAQTSDDSFGIFTQIYDFNVEGGDDSVFYSLGGTNASKFTIDADSGILFLNPDASFNADGAMADSYANLTVTATNAAGGTDTIDVTVTPANVNDAPTGILLNGEASGIIAVGTIADTDNAYGIALTATDDDNNDHDFVVSGGADARFFRTLEVRDDVWHLQYIGGDTLRDPNEDYVVRITATDSGDANGNNPRSYTEEVTITVTGLDAESLATELTDNDGTDVILGTFTPNTEVFGSTTLPGLTLTGSNAGDFTFASGVLTYTALPNHEALIDGMITATITVDDSGRSPQGALVSGFNQPFVFAVTDVDDNLPIFVALTDRTADGARPTESGAAITVTALATTTAATTATEGRAGVIYTPNTFDADTVGGAAAAQYAFTGDTQGFTIDVNTGVVSAGADLDFEDMSGTTMEGVRVRVLTITVADTDIAGETNTLTLTVNVNNLDDSDPTAVMGFDSTIPTGTDTTLAHSLGMLVAVDADRNNRDDDGMVADGYRFTLSGDNANSFQIVNGELFLRAGETLIMPGNRYDLDITVRDPGGATFLQQADILVGGITTSTFGAVVITDESVHDSSPFLPLGTLEVQQGVFADGAPLMFSFDSTDFTGGSGTRTSGDFTITESGGVYELRYGGDFMDTDHERTTDGSLTVTIAVTDGTEVIEHELAFAIGDRDDNLPVFVALEDETPDGARPDTYGAMPITVTPLTTTTAMTAATEGTAGLIYTPNTFDADTVDGTNLTVYALTGDSQGFTIDAATGAVSATADLDFEDAQGSTNAGGLRVRVVTISVTDADNTGTNSLELTINVNDVNEAPTGVTGFAPSIAVGTPIPADGILLGLLAATDPEADFDTTDDDDGTYEDGYRFALSGSDADQFTVTASDGMLRFIGTELKEAGDSYDLIITPTDDRSLAGTPVVTDIIVGGIALTGDPAAINDDVDHNAGVALGMIDVEDGVYDISTVALTYTITGSNAADFNLESPSLGGDLAYRGTADHEALADGSVTLTIMVNGMAEGAAPGDDRLIITQEFVFTVTDLDDNLPIFVAQEFATEDGTRPDPTVTALAMDMITATENTAGLIYTPNTYDRDTVSDDTALAVYALTGEMQGLAFDTTSGAISATADLDREDATEGIDRVVTITVTDADNTGSNAMVLTINVNNINEAPTAIAGSFVVLPTADGSAAAPVELGEFTTTDPDDTGDFTYTVTAITDSSGNAVADTDLFTIAGADNNMLGYTGALAATTADIGDSYNVTVSVTDDEGEAIATPEVFNVLVGGFGFSDISAPYSLDEHNGADRTERTVGTLDDLHDIFDPGATITWDIVNGSQTIDGESVGDFDGAFRRRGAQITTRSSDALDYEADNRQVGVDISATGMINGTEETITQTFVFTINNINDNAPVITGGVTEDDDTANARQYSHMVNVDENTDAATAVFTIVGSDPDGLDNMIAYSIGGADSALFTYDAASGAITFNAAPDHESAVDAGADNIYNLEILAIDDSDDAGGGTLLTSTVTVTINVVDANDNAPVFSLGTGDVTAGYTHAVNFNEAQTVDTVVHTASAVDLDTVGTISYTAVGGADMDLFSVDGDDGEVRFLVSPDADTAGDADGGNDYELIITANDEVNITTLTLTINLQEVNEAPEDITLAGQDATIQFYISSAQAAGAVSTNILGVASATDPDAGDVVTYAITGDVLASVNGGPAAQHDVHPFRVDSSSGQLSLTGTGTASLLAGAEYYLITITASDDDGTPLSSEAVFRINIGDLSRDTSGDDVLASIDEVATGGTAYDGTNANLGVFGESHDGVDASTIAFVMHNVGTPAGTSSAGLAATAVPGMTGDFTLTYSGSPDYETTTALHAVFTYELDGSDDVLTETFTINVNNLEEWGQDISHTAGQTVFDATTVAGTLTGASAGNGLALFLGATATEEKYAAFAHNADLVNAAGPQNIGGAQPAFPVANTAALDGFSTFTLTTNDDLALAGPGTHFINGNSGNDEIRFWPERGGYSSSTDAVSLTLAYNGNITTITDPTASRFGVNTISSVEIIRFTGNGNDTLIVDGNGTTNIPDVTHVYFSNAGNDNFKFDDIDDIGGLTAVDGGTGTDKIEYSGAEAATFILNPASGNQSVQVGTAAARAIFSAFENAFGNTGDDTFIDNGSGSNTYNGRDGAGDILQYTHTAALTLATTEADKIGNSGNIDHIDNVETLSINTASSFGDSFTAGHDVRDIARINFGGGDNTLTFNAKMTFLRNVDFGAGSDVLVFNNVAHLADITTIAAAGAGDSWRYTGGSGTVDLTSATLMIGGTDVSTILADFESVQAGNSGATYMVGGGGTDALGNFNTGTSDVIDFRAAGVTDFTDLTFGVSSNILTISHVGTSSMVTIAGSFASALQTAGTTADADLEAYFITGAGRGRVTLNNEQPPIAWGIDLREADMHADGELPDGYIAGASGAINFGTLYGVPTATGIQVNAQDGSYGTLTTDRMYTGVDDIAIGDGTSHDTTGGFNDFTGTTRRDIFIDGNGDQTYNGGGEDDEILLGLSLGAVATYTLSGGTLTHTNGNLGANTLTSIETVNLVLNAGFGDTITLSGDLAANGGVTGISTGDGDDTIIFDTNATNISSITTINTGGDADTITNNSAEAITTTQDWARAIVGSDGGNDTFNDNNTVDNSYGGRGGDDTLAYTTSAALTLTTGIITEAFASIGRDIFGGIETITLNAANSFATTLHFNATNAAIAEVEQITFGNGTNTFSFNAVANIADLTNVAAGTGTGDTLSYTGAENVTLDLTATNTKFTGFEIASGGTGTNTFKLDSGDAAINVGANDVIRLYGATGFETATNADDYNYALSSDAATLTISINNIDTVTLVGQLVTDATFAVASDVMVTYNTYFGTDGGGNGRILVGDETRTPFGDDLDATLAAQLGGAINFGELGGDNRPDVDGADNTPDNPDGSGTQDDQGVYVAVVDHGNSESVGHYGIWDGTNVPSGGDSYAITLGDGTNGFNDFTGTAGRDRFLSNTWDQTFTGAEGTDEIIYNISNLNSSSARLEFIANGQIRARESFESGSTIRTTDTIDEIEIIRYTARSASNSGLISIQAAVHGDVTEISAYDPRFDFTFSLNDVAYLNDGMNNDTANVTLVDAGEDAANDALNTIIFNNTDDMVAVTFNIGDYRAADPNDASIGRQSVAVGTNSVDLKNFRSAIGGAGIDVFIDDGSQANTYDGMADGSGGNDELRYTGAVDISTAAANQIGGTANDTISNIENIGFAEDHANTLTWGDALTGVTNINLGGGDDTFKFDTHTDFANLTNINGGAGEIVRDSATPANNRNGDTLDYTGGNTAIEFDLRDSNAQTVKIGGADALTGFRNFEGASGGSANDTFRIRQGQRVVGFSANEGNPTSTGDTVELYGAFADTHASLSNVYFSANTSEEQIASGGDIILTLTVGTSDAVELEIDKINNISTSLYTTLRSTINNAATATEGETQDVINDAIHAAIQRLFTISLADGSPGLFVNRIKIQGQDVDRLIDPPVSVADGDAGNEITNAAGSSIVTFANVANSGVVVNLATNMWKVDGGTDAAIASDFTTYIGSGQDDIFIINQAFLSGSDTIAAGAGNDVLMLVEDGGAAINLNNAATAARFTGFTTIRGSSTEADVITGYAGGSTLDGGGVAANGGTDQLTGSSTSDDLFVVYAFKGTPTVTPRTFTESGFIPAGALNQNIPIAAHLAVTNFLGPSGGTDTLHLTGDGYFVEGGSSNVAADLSTSDFNIYLQAVGGGGDTYLHIFRGNEETETRTHEVYVQISALGGTEVYNDLISYLGNTNLGSPYARHVDRVNVKPFFRDGGAGEGRILINGQAIPSASPIDDQPINDFEHEVEISYTDHDEEGNKLDNYALIDEHDSPYDVSYNVKLKFFDLEQIGGSNKQHVSADAFKQAFTDGNFGISFNADDNAWQLNFNGDSATADDDRSFSIIRSDSPFENIADSGGDADVVENATEFDLFIDLVDEYINFAS